MNPSFYPRLWVRDRRMSLFGKFSNSSLLISCIEVMSECMISTLDFFFSSTGLGVEIVFTFSFSFSKVSSFSLRDSTCSLRDLHLSIRDYSLSNDFFSFWSSFRVSDLTQFNSSWAYFSSQSLPCNSRSFVFRFSFAFLSSSITCWEGCSWSRFWFIYWLKLKRASFFSLISFWSASIYSSSFSALLLSSFYDLTDSYACLSCVSFWSSFFSMNFFCFKA